MKRITKRPEPRDLRNWKQNQNGVNCSYGETSAELKNTIKTSLLTEQGYLCCYTGIGINLDSSHIEHLKPQTLCHNHEDVDYNNMLAAYPAKNAKRCDFGAHAKDNWYDENDLIHPLRPDCETKFTFSLEGEIYPREAGDKQAEKTIKQLRLDKPQLTELRKNAIDELLFPQNESISLAKARQTAEELLQQDNGKFKEFCFVLIQTCHEHIRRLEKKHIKTVAIQRQKNKRK